MTTQLAYPCFRSLSPGELALLPRDSLLGEGSTAQVYLCSSWKSELSSVEFGPGKDASAVVSECALKVARGSCNGVLLREARALALAQGPGVPRLYGLGISDSRVCLAMERIQGLQLDSYLELNRDASVERRCELAQRVLGSLGIALQQLHALGWAHRDVKPQNILIDEGGGELSVHLIDFGLASDELTVHSGTPLYIPPQVFGGKSIGAGQGDAYALCRTLAGIFDRRWHQEREFSDGFAQIPPAFEALLRPILEGKENLWPNVAWLGRAALQSGLLPTAHDTMPNLRQYYLATRFTELSEISAFRISVAGLPGIWCSEFLQVFSQAARLERGEAIPTRDEMPHFVVDLSAHDRCRFLGRLLGPLAANWELPAVSDQLLIETLYELAKRGPLRAITFAKLSEALRHPAEQASQAEPGPQAELSSEEEEEHAQEDACRLAFQLGERPVSIATLLTIHTWKKAPLVLVERAARVARLAGELDLAALLVDRCPSPLGQLERARIFSLKNDRAAATSILSALCSAPLAPQIRSSALALLARFAVDRGEYEEATSLLAQAEDSAAKYEVGALIQLMHGNLEASDSALTRGSHWSRDAEAKARLLGLQGMLEHARGNSMLSLDHFQRAVEAARSAGAALEEATYLTGVAAAASDAGLLSTSLDASERAEQLFESLEKHAQTARALLARAAVLCRLGAQTELSAVVARGLALARRGQDVRCEAFLLLCASDALDPSEEKTRLASRAWESLKDAHVSDRLSAATRLLDARGQIIAEADEWALSSTNQDLQLEWWRARAQALLPTLAHEDSEAAQLVLRQLEPFAQSGPVPLSLGPALVVGAQLALRMGRAETARSFLHGADKVAHHFLEHMRPEHRPCARQLTWVEQAQASGTPSADWGNQLSDVEGLLKALGRRNGFRALLDQVLDMLLLWTGVERGLLLLRAPGGGLVIRASRNLQRGDLMGEQRELSLSVAKRAVEEGRPIILVDASKEVSQLHRSVVALSLRSVLAVPLIARGEVLGVAYLDDRVKKSAFGQKELSWAQLISTVAALAIAEERDSLALKRTLRRAERAERRLAERLAKNEIELELAERKINFLSEERQLTGTYENIIGRSRAMRDLLAMVERVAASDVPVLIEGESGTGKELIARAIAEAGGRRAKPFVAENCGAVPETLLESALFGHRKGAFTGASRNQPGLFTLADGGTLFLDEIGEMPLSMQTKLLRVLQEGEVKPLGADRPIKVNVRLIVATHRDLEGMVAQGSFRQDLYFRLNVVRLRVPSLRERKEDIPLLVAHFLAQHAKEPRTLSSAALGRLCSFPWPGNVRQLENEVRRMIVLGGTHLSAADLSPEVLDLSASESGPSAHTLREKLDALERQLVIEALEKSGGNRTRAADALGVSRFGLQKMTQRLLIDLDAPLQKSGRIRPRGLDEQS